MTGKDFSGPVPIIRAKTAPNLEPASSEAIAAAKKQSKTPGPTEAAPKEAGADVETVQTSSTRPGSKAAPNTVSQKGKKPANGPSRDDVEVLGTIDGDWD